MLPCQVALKENSKCNLMPISHVMKILTMHKRGIFLDFFMRWPLPKVTWCEICYRHWFDFIMAPPITKVQRREEEGKAGGGGVGFLSCRKGGYFIPISQLVSASTDSMWHSGPEIKPTISTGMHWHIILYFNWSLCDFCEIQARSCFLIILSCDMFVAHSHVIKAHCKRTHHPL